MNYYFIIYNFTNIVFLKCSASFLFAFSIQLYGEFCSNSKLTATSNVSSHCLNYLFANRQSKPSTSFVLFLIFFKLPEIAKHFFLPLKYLLQYQLFLSHMKYIFQWIWVRNSFQYFVIYFS